MSKPTTAQACGCAGSTLYDPPHPKALTYCPTHAAAPRMLALLVRIAAGPCIGPALCACTHAPDRCTDETDTCNRCGARAILRDIEGLRPDVEG